MKSTILRIILYPLAFLLPILAFGALTFQASMGNLYSPSPAFEGEDPAPPRHEPVKPTVAVLLGGAGTEVTDFLVPYELFSRSERFNVYAVAPELKLSPLTGGLDVLPQHDYQSLEQLLSGRPDVIVVPAMVDPKSAANEPVIAWLKANAGQGTLVLGICSGAAVLAEAGLLDGQTATSHWGDLDRWARQYPTVRWVRGQRYVDEGNFVTTAGLTSGIDGVLHALDRLIGREAAMRVAREVHYDGLRFLDDPAYPVRRFGAADGVYPLNAAFRPVKPDLGVLLYDGVGEMPLASVIDTYAATFSAHLLSIAPERETVTSRHGLSFVPRWSFDDTPRLERLLVPGKGDIGTGVGAWAQEQGMEVERLHAEAIEGSSPFAFDAPVQDLARWANLPTARFAAKRLELLSTDLPEEGRGWPLHLLLAPLGLGLGGVGLAAALDRGVLSRFRQARRADGHTPVGTSHTEHRAL